MAYLVGHYTRADARFLNWRITLPVIRCGQHSLYIFCLGISLSFVAHFLLVEFGRSWTMQVLVVLGGLAVMTALAYLLHWYKTRSTPKAVAPAPKAAETPAPSHNA